MSKLHSLQVLRALAASIVVVYHINYPSLHIGSFGVDIFFVLSGFIIAYVLSNRPPATQFMLDRLTRVLPLYYVMTLSLFLITIAKPTLLNSTTANPYNLVKSLLFIPYHRENGLIAPFLAVGWTLNYEMIFYLISWLCYCYDPRQALTHLSVCMLVVFYLAHQFDPSYAVVEFYCDGHFLEFLLGLAMYPIYKTGARLNPVLALLLIPSCLVALSYIELRLPIDNQLLDYGLLSAVLLYAFLSLDAHLQPQRIPLLIHLGDASYAIYLSHLFVVEGCRKAFPLLSSSLNLSSPLGACLALLASLAVGSLLYQWVDRPLVRLVKRGRKRRLAIRAIQSLG